HLRAGPGIQRPLDSLHGRANHVLPGQHSVTKCDYAKYPGQNGSRAHPPTPCQGARTPRFHPPYLLRFSIAGALQRMTASDTGMHVIFKQKSASRGKLLRPVSRDQRLKISAAAQRLRAAAGARVGLRNRFPDPLARLGDRLVVHLFTPDFRKHAVKLLAVHDLSPRYALSSLRSCCRVRCTMTATSTW